MCFRDDEVFGRTEACRKFYLSEVAAIVRLIMERAAMNEQTPLMHQVRDYWDSRPCNLRHSEAPIGTREYFDEVEARKYRVEPHIPEFAQFSRWADKRVLEVGCGIGTDAVNFARAGADYTGVELSAKSLEIATRRFDVFGLDGTLCEANAENLSECLPANHFDLVYSFGVLHHTPRPEVAFSEIRQVIDEGGEFRMMLYAKSSWKAAMIGAGFDQPEAQFGVPIANQYTHQEVTDILGASGFEVASIEQEHIFPYVVEKYIRYEYELQPWFAAMPKEMFRALEKAFGWHLLIVAKPV